MVVAALLVSCSGNEETKVDTTRECQDAGGRVVANPGPIAKCEATEEQIGFIPFGIEGAICCRPR
jgi:hypothetical protein